MGCSASAGVASLSSKTRAKFSDQEASNGYFTESQKRLVARTWKYMAVDLTGNGTKVFNRIFERNPHLKALFPFRDQEGEDLVKDVNFKGHASRFMQSVGAVLDNMDDPETALAQLLIGLGKNHLDKGDFQEDYFYAFVEAMQFVWRQELAERYTGAVEESWALVFNFIINKLKEGYRQASEERGLQHEIPNGLSD